MDIIKLKTGQNVRCPHCQEDYDEPVEDFVIPGRLGADSTAEEECVHCDKLFSVTRIAENEFEVEPLDSQP